MTYTLSFKRVELDYNEINYAQGTVKEVFIETDESNRIQNIVKDLLIDDAVVSITIAISQSDNIIVPEAKTK